MSAPGSLIESLGRFLLPVGCGCVGRLSAKRRAFVEEYLRCGFNATEAARRVGYKHPNHQGPRLLVNVGIAAAITARIAERAMGADEVLDRLGEQARADIGEMLTEDGTLSLVQAKQLGLTRLIKSINDTDKGLRVELYSAQEALALLGKHHGLFLDKLALTDPSGKQEYGDLTDEQRVARIAELLDAARARRDGQAAGSGGGEQGGG